MKQNQPWPNGVASRLGLLATLFGQDLHAFAMTCIHFGQDQICMQVKASFSPFGHPTQINTSWVMPINLLLANWKKFRICLLWNGFFGTCIYLWGNLWVHLATQCKFLRKFSLCPPATIAGPFDQGLKARVVCPSFLLLLTCISFKLFVIHTYMYECFLEMQCISSSCGVGSRSAYPDFYFYAVGTIST